MLYVERNAEGRIVALHKQADKAGFEQKMSIDEEVIAFLEGDSKVEALIHALTATDNDLLRILEDLIDLLVKKNIIMYTELPDKAQKKLQLRRHFRQNIAKSSIIVDDIV
jgi:hypothetical protein